jgi:YD repeat-containing protein
MTTSTDPLGNIVQWTYDACSNVLSGIAANGSVKSNTYDWAGRVLKSTDQLGRVTTYSYDVSGNEISFIDGNKNSYAWNYDLLNRANREVYPLGSTENWTFYPYGLLQTYTKRDGNVKTYQYDNMDRPTGWSWASGQSTSASYDIGGRMTEVTNPVSDIKYQYDAANEVTSETQYPAGLGAVTINYNYTTDGLPAGLQIPNVYGPLVYGYTGRDQLKTITNNGFSLASYTYDAAGNRLTRALANTTVAKYTYDADNRVTILEEDQGVTAVLRNHYNYDANSRITSIAHDQSGSGITYSYDLANQVTNFVNKGPSTGWGPEAPADTKAFTYDNAGNRTKLTDNGGAEDD